MTFALGRDFNVEIAGLVAEEIARLSMGFQGGKPNLGGGPGPDGGSGLPPTGFSGQLIQKKSAYDTTEGMSVETTSGSSLLDNLNHIRAWLDPARWLRAQAQSPPDMTLYVRPGIVYFTGWGAPTVFGGGNSPAFTAPPSQNRIDVLYMDDDGVLQIKQGVAGADPAPSYPTSGSTMGIAEVYLRSTSGSVLNDDDGISGYIHRDVRPFLNLGGGGGGAGGGPSDTIDGVSNLGGDIDFVAGANMTITPNDEANTITFASSGSGGVAPDGVLVLTARGGEPRTDSGCGVATKREIGTTNHIDKYVLPFDKDADEFAQWSEIVMPTDWDGGTITARFVWTCDAGVGGANKAACWGLRGRSWGDDEAIDQALGTAQFVTDTWLADKDTHISAVTSAITLAGTPAAGELVTFEVQRDVSEDDLAGDAWLITVLIEFTRA